MTELIYFIRVVAAGICGIIIGYERKSRAKEAGIRTHCIVACAAALMMIVSKYGFFDLISKSIYEGADIRLDPSRVAQGIVSGIGFLGAGMIFVQKQTVKGLTTAAGIWATSGIGMAIGAGMYIIGFLVTLLILFAQIILHRDNKFLAVPHYKQLNIYNADKEGCQKEITEQLESMKIIIEDVSVSFDKTTNNFNFVFTLELPANTTEEELVSSLPFSSSVETIK